MVSLVRFCVLEKICTRSVSHGKFQIFREARMMDKMIKKQKRQPKAIDSMPRRLRQEVLSSAYDNEGTSRKTVALNKFYMENVIDLINSGPYNNEINELGIEFTKVKITPCRSSIKVYWISNKTEISESETSKLLQDIRKDLQAQIGFLKSMRRIPLITFAKDLRLERQNIVEKLLEVADFGKDFQPSSAKKVVKPDSNEVQEIKNSENLKMRQNVLGLDHAKIEEKLKQNVKKFQAINLKKNELEEVTHYEHMGKLAVFSKKLFISFYKRKQYLDKKLRTKEYDGTFIEFDKQYDPNEEADKYWELFKFKDDLMDGLDDYDRLEDEHEKHYTDLYDNIGEEDNDSDDNYCEERDINDLGNERG